MTAFFRLSRFGMTFKPLTEGRGEELLTSYLADFHVKTSASPEKAQDLMANAAECGNTWRGWLAKYDPDTSSWKTAQCSFIEDLNGSSVTLPRSGMTRDGLLWELPTLERPTSGTGSGLWPTPTTQDNVQVRGMGAAAGKPTRGTTLGGAVRYWPTPVAYDTSSRTTTYAQGGTPLSYAVKFWPTPTCQDVKNNGAPSQKTRNTPPLNAAVGGSLNPMWIEWLMGWPLGWTDLKPLETDKSRSVLPQHGII
jgi:hypothetical protein